MDAARRARLLGLWSLLVYLFLYAPLAVLAAFSFNEERLTAQWRGFTLDWYARLLENTQILTALRNSLLPAYVILHDATLAEIARRRPRDLAALSEVPGIGARKLERYGTALLELMSEP